MDILATLEQLRQQAASEDDAVLQRIIDRYLAMVKRLDGRVEALRLFMEANQDNLTVALVENSEQFTTLLSEFEQEMGDYSAWLATELKAEVTRSSEAGRIAGISLLAAVLGVTISELASPSGDALETLGDFTASGSPLIEKIKGMAVFYADYIKNLVLAGVGTGSSFLTIAEDVIDKGFGIALTDAMRWARTVQNYSYRWATLASYEANGIEGWIWWAELDERVCASCVSLHGTLFALSDGVANDHHNGRCAMIPYIQGETDNLVNPNAGAEWFGSLNDEAQKDIMGVGKWEAWKAGRFDFKALSTTYEDDTFGTMRRETTLKELIG